jgi:hypothetical protein
MEKIPSPLWRERERIGRAWEPDLLEEDIIPLPFGEREKSTYPTPLPTNPIL